MYCLIIKYVLYFILIKLCAFILFGIVIGLRTVLQNDNGKYQNQEDVKKRKDKGIKKPAPKKGILVQARIKQTYYEKTLQRYVMMMPNKNIFNKIYI